MRTHPFAGCSESCLGAQLPNRAQRPATDRGQHTRKVRTRPLLLGDDPPEPRRPCAVRTGVLTGDASAARRAVSTGSAALPLYAGIPLAGAASAPGP